MILKSIAQNIGLDLDPSVPSDQLQEQIFNYFETHSDIDKKIILLFDDIQEYDISLLEHIKWLGSFHTTKGFFPFKLILFGHQSTIEKISNPQFGSFLQKIRKKFVLDNLDALETKEYIYFRLLNSGAKGFPFFPDDVIMEIFNRSKGVPRIINTICDACLTVGAKEGKKIIDLSILGKALELLDHFGPFQEGEVTKGHEAVTRGHYRPAEEMPLGTSQAMGQISPLEGSKADFPPKPESIPITVEPEAGTGRALGDASAKKEVFGTSEILNRVQRYAKAVFMIMLALLAIGAALLVGDQVIKRFNLLSVSENKVGWMEKRETETKPPLLVNPKKAEPEKGGTVQSESAAKENELDFNKRLESLINRSQPTEIQTPLDSNIRGDEKQKQETPLGDQRQ
jgi:hypothetical protein